MTWRTHTDSPLRHSASGRARRQRHHGSRQPFDRWELERAGWRTTLEYRENLVRDRTGQLGAVEAEWRAEGERVSAQGDVIVVSSVGVSPADAWNRLRTQAELAAVKRRRREPQGR